MTLNELKKNIEHYDGISEVFVYDAKNGTLIKIDNIDIQNDHLKIIINKNK